LRIIIINNNNNNNKQKQQQQKQQTTTTRTTEKIIKYKNITIEIQRMWNVKTNVIPVIIWAGGTISKLFRKYLNNVPGKQEMKELQKTAILGTAHTAESTNVKVQ
jgi:hypothetical protein